jgi:hypothetical protein
MTPGFFQIRAERCRTNMWQTCRSLVIGVLLAASGCKPPVQSEACKRYVACQGAYDKAAGHEAKPLNVYEKTGFCWSDEQAANQCTLECTEGLSALGIAAASAALNVPECRDR